MSRPSRKTERVSYIGEKMKQCEVCCIPMENAEDFGGGNISNGWCVHCCHADGSHKSYDEILRDMTEFMLSDECEFDGMKKATSRDEALAKATAFVHAMPVWAKEKNSPH